MRLLITIGMIVIFISAFFIMFTIDSIIKADMNCVPGQDGKMVCNLEGMGTAFIFKVTMIGLFITISVVTVYFVITNAMPGVYYAKSGKEEW